MALGFLIDENVPMDVMRAIVDAGRDARESRLLLGLRAPDEQLIAAARASNLIVVTWNRKHFNRARAHVLAFNCPEPHGADRLRTVWDLVELEARLADERGHRFIVQINDTAVWVRR